MLNTGVFAAVVETAITRPNEITKHFIDAVNKSKTNLGLSYAKKGVSVMIKECFPEELSIRLSGRTLYRDKTLYLLHAASYIEFEFTGKLLEADMESEGGGEDFQAWIGIYVNDMDNAYQRIHLKKGKHRYRLWESSRTGKVLIRIVKLSENQYAYTAINKFILDENACIQKTAAKKKRVEFIGDSITCGFGNEGNPGDLFTTETENPLKAYGALTAGKLDCDFTIVAWSGIGIISSWIPPEVEEPNEGMLVPMVYPYVDYGLFGKKGWIPNEKYDYERDNCDAIVVNLGTNDASYTRDNEIRKQAFFEAYQKFIRYLRLTHRKKAIICTSGAMTDLLDHEIQAAVEALRKEEHDSLLYYMKFGKPDAEDGEGAVGHPSMIQHEKMAEQLSAWIKEMGIL